MKRFLPAVLLVLVLPGLAAALPSYEEVRRAYGPSDSLLLDRGGELLQELRMDPLRRRLQWTPLTRISPTLVAAVIRAEDRRFHEHAGVDYLSAGAALFRGITSAGLRGASTISMQLAALLEPDLKAGKKKRSLGQKARQALAARKMERTWSKEKILEAYLNLVTFRGELQGIAAASRGLFGKDPHGLDRPEALILASLIRFPAASFDEVARRADLLARSLQWPFEKREIMEAVLRPLAGGSGAGTRVSLAPHAARRLLRGRPAGAQVSCTLDKRLQQFVLETLVQHLLPLRPRNVRDAAVLVVENRTGEILAYASHSGEPERARFVDGVQAKRQAGSTLKPFLYALAFDRRILTPVSLLNDAPVDVPVPGGIYRPLDYEGRFQGPVTTRVALASSLNVPAVETLSLVGQELFLRTLRRLGFEGLHESGDYYGPSLALGTADVSLWDLVNAYRTLANGGERREQRFAVHETPLPPQRIFSPQAAFLVSDILADREARSITFGLESPLATPFWSAVKTGTSKDMRDNWCLGYSRKYTVGVWVGNFSGEPMWNMSGVSGAAPVWVEIMKWLHRGQAPSWGVPPRGVVLKEAGLPPSLQPTGREWFIRGTEPASGEGRIGQENPRILYPPPGTVMAMDPDIPPGRQKVFFLSQAGAEDCRWVLNGLPFGGPGRTSWDLRPGKFFLALVDGRNRVLDAVHFEVRGPSEN